MKKRLLVVCLCLMMMGIIILSGCSKKSGTMTAGEIENAFVIGELFSGMGEYASYGKSLHNGAYMAVKDINESGGLTIGGEYYKLEIKSIDDESNADMARNAYNTLVDKGAMAVTGPFSDEGVKAVEELAHEDNILMIIPSSTSSDTGHYDNSFKMMMSDLDQGEEIADHAFNQMGCKNAAVLYREDDTELVEAFINRFLEFGGDVPVREVYNDMQEVSDRLSRINTVKPDIIFMPSDKENASNLLELADNKDIRSMVIGDLRWSGILPGHYRNHIHVEYPSFSGEKYKKFLDSYQKEYGISADIYAAQGYDSIYAIKEALERAGNTDSDLQICAMTSVKFDGITGDGISFNEDGDSSREMEFVRLN